jgi:flagella basal body P-ring formation protein FlgA
MRTAAIVLLLAAAAQAVTVRLREAASVEGVKVTLGDVASIENAAPSERARLAAIVVDFVDAGGSAAVSADTVRDVLIGTGANAATTLVVGARETAVSRGADGRNAIETALRRYLSTESADSRFTVSEIRTDFDLPADFEPLVTASRTTAGSGAVRFDVADARRPKEKIGHVFAAVEEERPVLVASRDLRGGHRLSARDFELQYVSADAAGVASSDARSLIGKQLVRSLSAGESIPSGALKTERVVKRGDEVTLTLDTGTVTVSATTVALEEGALGDVIKLRQKNGRTVFTAKVTGVGRAAVVDGGR